MKIAIGSLQCESNTFCPLATRKADFDIAIGEAMLEKVHVKDLLEDARATIVPTLYAHALPGGAVAKEDFLWFVDQIVTPLPTSGLAGIWLYLHGAMYVEEIGSGEAYLLKHIREKVGYALPIALALDFHANNSDEICDLANIICGFRTAPHTDQIATERKAMQLLLQSINEKLLPSPRLARPYVLVPGDAVQTSVSPLREIMEESDRMELSPEILCAQVFGGQQWVDSPYTGPSMVVTHKHETAIAQDYANSLAKLYWQARSEFSFLIEALEPAEAITAALQTPDKLVFISDSGDNTTAGAAGDNGFFINLLQNYTIEKVLIAGIADSQAVARCYKSNLGDTLTLTVGGSLSPRSEKAQITGTLVHRGDIIGYTGELAGESATIDCGNFTVVITEQRTAFTRKDIFQSIHLDVFDFRIVVVKLGYLFPELEQLADRSILAFTPGSSAERIQDIGLTQIPRPMYPFDDNFY